VQLRTPGKSCKKVDVSLLDEEPVWRLRVDFLSERCYPDIVFTPEFQ